jgi:hypothetical protein
MQHNNKKKVRELQRTIKRKKRKADSTEARVNS